jgi:hypothetical protein
MLSEDQWNLVVIVAAIALAVWACIDGFELSNVDGEDVSPQTPFPAAHWP